jgi:hypothetical protein
MSNKKLELLVERETQKRLDALIKAHGGVKRAVKANLCEDKEDLMELVMADVGEEFVIELEKLCDL